MYSVTRICAVKRTPSLFLRCKSTNADQFITINNKTYKSDPEFTNVTPSIISHVNRSLHKKPNHPVNILRDLIEKKLSSVDDAFTTYNNFTPVVSTFENFDSLGFPADHPGRSKSDTYYVNDKTLLRTHTSAHEMECYNKVDSTGKPGFLISADVYRRDEIDKTHYPVFHQMEGCRVWKNRSIDEIKSDLKVLQKKLDEHEMKLIVEDRSLENTPEENPKQQYMTDQEVDLVSQHLKRSLELVISEVFNQKINSMKKEKNSENIPNELKVRWVNAYFPWTTPSWEIEVWWNNDWLEVCGCGIVQQQVLLNAGYEKDSTISWAFGLGLDRIAMLLFEIPDIRLLWSEDNRFISQFTDGSINTFKPYSKYPGSTRDVAFWLADSSKDSIEIHENDLMEIVRNAAGSLVESVKLIDRFQNPKTNKTSLCYRINYQSMDRNITNDEVNQIQKQVETELVDKYHVSLR
ncbi:similar to Saccharomyces cerevisiae YPR047W MSF1 Mitochondrial phenylalanyl-tRNA synthetase [Maudiozyma saulgeensis]|uniref:Phenylalanine--tRNA ligase, mitochondrial n=1 Tax=Maudiozyma saulgeensis TaxID=1789683 RepID=A0A1X7R459_9SACH|nr:similar to Saccharomyces cerevisiae YPR047W MSF1 Mitochondrial phenylalanyl-tRNA synthetase [Kazachstania saulgeensis]